MRASIVVVIISLLSACVADFAYSSFTAPIVQSEFITNSNAQFDATSSSIQLVQAQRNKVGSAFHVNYIDYYTGDYTGEYIAPGFITQFTYQINGTIGNGGAGVALVLQPNSAVITGTTGAGIGYGDYQNGQQGIPNSLAIEFDNFLDGSMNDPNNNHVGVHSTGDNPNSSNENAVILGLRNTTIPALLNGTNTIQHTVYIEYQANVTTLIVYLDGQQVLFNQNFTLTDYIFLEPGTGESYIGLTSSTNPNDFFDLDILSWYFWQGNGTLVPDSTLIYGSGYDSAIYDEINTYYIQLIDNYGYNITTNATTPTCAVGYGSSSTNLTGIVCTVTYLDAGLYQASYNMTLVGAFTLVTTVDTYVNTNPLLVTGPPDALQTVASGPGLSSAIAGIVSSFTITTYDASGAPSNGDASFTITLVLTTDNSVVVTGQASAPNGTGIYTATYTVTVAGIYSLSVVLVGQTDIKGSPFTVTAVAGPYSPANCVASGPGISSGVAGQVNYFNVTAYDAFGNLATSPPSWNLSGDTPIILPTSTPISNSVTNNTYVQTVAGDFSLSVLDITSGNPIQGSPFSVTIIPGLAAPANTTATGDLSTGQAGVIGNIIITPADQYGNLVNDNNILFTVTLTPGGYSTNATYQSDGTYVATYNVTAVGTYQVAIVLVSGGASSGPINGSPFTLTVAAGPVYIPLCYAYGQGLSTAEAGVMANFTIQTVDAFNNTLTSGNSTVFVLTFDNNFVGTTNVVPNNDGTYFATYTGNATGIFDLTVSSGSEQILGSPFSVNITSGPVFAPSSIPSGTGLTSAVAGETADITIQTFDQFGNPVTGYGGPCTGYIVNDNDSSYNYTLTCVYVSGNVYNATYNVTFAGDYEVYIFINGLAVQSTPSSVTVAPGPLVAASCTASGPGLTSATAGVPATFNITAKDQFGNLIPGNPLGVPPFTVVLTKGNETVTGFVTYLGPGTYLANYTLTSPTGTWSLNVTTGGVNIKGSPFTVTLVAGAVDASKSYIVTPLADATAYEPYTFYVQAVDLYNNLETTNSGVTFVADLTAVSGGISITNLNSSYAESGRYSFTFAATAGTYDVFVSLNSINVQNDPQTLVVTPGLPVANMTIVTGFGRNFSRAGEVANFTIVPYDLGGQPYTGGNQNFSISLTQTTGNITTVGNVTLSPNPDGTYLGQYNVTLAAVWDLSINLTSGNYPGPVVGSPFFPIVYAGPNCPENAQVNGLSNNITVGDVQLFQIQSRDCYNNSVDSTDVYYDVLIQGPDCSFGNTTYWQLGIINVTYVVNEPGNYTVYVNERGEPILGSPFAVVANGGEEDVAPESNLSSTSLIFMWLMIVFIILYVIFCLLLIGFVVFTQRKQLQRNFSNYKKIQSDSSSSSSSD